MPFFLFHLRTALGLEHDEIGLDLPDVEAAYLEAVRTIPSMAPDLLCRGAKRS